MKILSLLSITFALVISACMPIRAQGTFMLAADATATAAAVPPKTTFVWQIEQVDGAPNMAGGSALAIDGEGNSYITYSLGNTSAPTVKLARQQPEGWTSGAIPAPADGPFSLGAVTRLGVDAQGVFHVAYISYDSYGQQLFYAGLLPHRFDDSGFPSPASLSLALDATGQPHIAYCTQDGSSSTLELQLRYAHNDGEWHDEPINDEGCWLSTSLVFDAAGDLHLAFFGREKEEQAYQLKYGKRTQDGWQFEVIETLPPYEQLISHAVSLALDTEGVPHLSYISSSEHAGGQTVLKYVRLVGDTWQHQTVAATGPVSNTSEPTPIALDTAGNPYIAYFDRHAMALKLAWLAGDDWQYTTIETTTSAFIDDIALALDNDNRPRLSYHIWTSDYGAINHAQGHLETLPYSYVLPFVGKAPAIVKF